MKNRLFVNNNTIILFLFIIGSILFIELNFRYWYRFLEQYMMFQTQLQGKRSPFYFTGISVNKDFLKKKLSVQLSFQNPFWKRMKMENTSSDDTFFRRETNYRTMRMLQVSVSYRFGTLKDAIKKVKRGINNDDVKSGGSGGGEQQM